MNSDDVKLFGEVWNRQRVMVNGGIVQKKTVLLAVFDQKQDRSKNLCFWNGCYGIILYNICADKWFFCCKYAKKKS